MPVVHIENEHLIKSIEDNSTKSGFRATAANLRQPIKFFTRLLKRWISLPYTFLKKDKLHNRLSNGNAIMTEKLN